MAALHASRSEAAGGRDSSGREPGEDAQVSGTIYVFLDESGNLDFTAGGTRYFVMTSVSMERPFPMNDALDAYQYDCLELGLPQEYFHAAEDNRRVREMVFDIIGAHVQDMRVDSLIVEKRKTGPALRAEGRFYPEMLGYLLKHVLSMPSHKKAEEVIIITDTLPVQRKREAIRKTIQSTLAKMLPAGAKYKILHHNSRAHRGLQVADYCCWAIYRKHEEGDLTAYNRISPAVLSEFDIFRGGWTYYY